MYKLWRPFNPLSIDNEIPWMMVPWLSSDRRASDHRKISHQSQSRIQGSNPLVQVHLELENSRRAGVCVYVWVLSCQLRTHVRKSLYIKRGKVSVRNERTYVRNGGRGQLSSEWCYNENDVIMRTGAASAASAVARDVIMRMTSQW